MHLLDRIVTAIAKGEEVRRHAFQQSENLVVAHEGVEATLTRNRGSNAWLLSGWEIRKPSLADGAGYVASAATSAKPTTAQLHRGEGTPSIDQETTESNSPSFSRKAGDAQQQFKDTERAYGGKAAYEQAKAAGKTKLTYGQWVQVRTPSFKQWFGDWEVVKAKDTLQEMQPVIITADEVLQSGTIAEARVRAKAMYAALKPASTVDGRRVQFPMSGFKETMQHAADRRVLLAMPQLSGLIGQAVPLWVEASTKTEKPNVRAFRHYGAKATFPDGDALVRIVLREDNDGHVYYDNNATTVETLTDKKAPADNHQPDRKPKPGEDAEGLSSNRLAQWWNSVNPAEVSKVIDPQTGEPMVQYHSTHLDFSASACDAKPSTGRHSTLRSLLGRYAKGQLTFALGSNANRAGRGQWHVPRQRTGRLSPDRLG